MSVAKGLKMFDLTLSLLLLLKQNIGFKTLIMLSVTFKFWITLEFFRRLANRRIKHYDFGVEYKPNGRTCKFQDQ